jgi:hypothetical protein
MKGLAFNRASGRYENPAHRARAEARIGNFARVLALKLEEDEFTRLFEILDRQDLAETLADEVARIEEKRRPEELAPRSRSHEKIEKLAKRA